MTDSQSKKSHPHFRRKFLINPKVQLLVIGTFVFLYIGSMGLFYYAMESRLTLSVLEIDSLDSTSKQVFSDLVFQLKDFIRLLIISYTAVSSVVFLLIGVIVTHRISGPVYAIRRQIRHFLEGNPATPITLRKSDFLNGLAKDVNKLLAKAEILQKSARQ